MIEVFDTAILVLRAWFAPLLLAFGVAALPLAILNDVLLSSAFTDSDDLAMSNTWYIFHMSILVFGEAQLASIFSTPLLGRAVFRSRPALKQIVWETMQASFKLGWSHMLARGVGAMLLLYVAQWIASGGYSETGGILFVFVCWIVIARSMRPFINEIILLERNPLWSKFSNVLTVKKRSTMLQSICTNSLIAQWTASIPLAAFLVSLVSASLWFGVSLFSSDWELTPWRLRIGFPVSLWLVALYFSVVRYLFYLDTRIRQEGWEVELRIRAEAERLQRSVA